MHPLPSRVPPLSRRLVATLAALALAAVPLIAAVTHEHRGPCEHDGHGCEAQEFVQGSARGAASLTTNAGPAGACGACALLASLAGTALAPIATVASSFDLVLSFQAPLAPVASIAIHAPLSRGPPQR